jgi:hypothetical protein
MLYLCRPNIYKATIDRTYKQGWALSGRKATTWKDKICKRQWGRLAYTLSFERGCRCGALAKLDAVIHNPRFSGNNWLLIPLRLVIKDRSDDQSNLEDIHNNRARQT